MRYEITGKNGFVPTEAIKDYVKKRFDKIVNFFDKRLIEEVRVVLKVYKDHHRVEVTIPAPYIVLRAETKDPDMYTAIDKTVDKLSQQIRKHKSKLRHHFESKDVKQPFTQEFDAQSLEKEMLASQLVKQKKIAITPMSVDEAITAMELSGHSFFIFLDEKTNNPQIVYRRDDGDYAVIETTPQTK